MSSISVLEIFTIGIGPSSSHTVGPMRAARRFLDRLRESCVFDQVARVEVHLYGSLALTGKGHGTDKALLVGLEGETPEETDVDAFPGRVERIRTTNTLRLDGCRCVSLGTQTPVWDIVLAATAQRSDVVALGFSSVLTPSVVTEGLTELRGKLPRPVEIWAGGSAPVLSRRPTPGVTTLPTLAQIGEETRRWRGERS